MSAEATVEAVMDIGYSGTAAVTGVDFSASAGERVALLGPNGGGKSTLIRTLSGDLAPVSGSFRVSGKPGLVPQHDPARTDWPATALDLAICGTLDSLRWWQRPGRRERSRALEALESVGLADSAGTLYGELSGGQRRRAQVASALAGSPSVLLLDEPFAGLDGVAAEELERVLEKLALSGTTLLIATHDLDQASSWERVLCLNERQIAYGSPATTLDRDVLERTFGSEIVELADGRLVTPPHHHHH